MARPMKRKRIGCCMDNRRFGPCDSLASDVLALPVEAFETLRLIDYLGLDQTAAAKKMDVSRSTVQKLYKDARATLVKAMVENASIIIQGGKTNVTTCQDKHHKHERTTTTRILMPLDGDNVAQSVVDSERFWMVTLDAGRIVRKDTIVAEGTEKKGCRRFVMSLGVTTVIAAGMTSNVHERYQASGIATFYGSGKKEDVLSQYVSNNLDPMKGHISENGCCHGEHHHEGDEGCCEGEHHEEKECCG